MRIVKSIFVIILLLGCPMVAYAQSLIPPFKIGEEATIKVKGYAQGLYSSNPPEEKNSCEWLSLRFRFDLDTKTPLGATLEVESRHIDMAEKNWLRKAYFSYKINDSWKINAGRFVLAAGYTLPAPFQQETVSTPRIPGSCYAYGTQLLGKWGKDWSIVADISGAAGKAFDDKGNFERIESSFRIEKLFEKPVLSFALTGQFSEEYQRGILDFTYKPIEKVSLRGAIYAADEVESNCYGGYLFAGWKLFDIFELHSQMDYCRSDPGEDSLIWTNGIRLWEPNDYVSLTLDYDTVVMGEEENRLLLRLQFRF